MTEGTNTTTAGAGAVKVGRARTGAAGAARRRTTLIMAGAAFVSMALGALSLTPPAPPSARSEIGELVVSGFEDRSNDVRLIMITTSEESYHLVREGDGWVLPEKGGYRVRPERIGELTLALASLRYARPMTRDERKFDRIGLGDPGAGGSGALVEIGNGQGDSFAKLVVGYRDGTSYVRDPADLQAWATTGEAMPPLQRAARWLDLEIVQVAEADIAEVEMRPVGQVGYRLLPLDGAGGQFGLAPPFDTRRLIASFGPSLPARALARLSPADVAPQADLVDAVLAGEHVTRTRDGLEVKVRAWRWRESGWLTLSATGPGSEPINARAADWAFAAPQADWSSFTTPLEALVSEE